MALRLVYSLLACFAIIACLLPWPTVAAESDLLGEWQTHKGGFIEFYPCPAPMEEKVCGKVSRLARTDHISTPTDVNNPDKVLRNRPLLGLQLFEGFTYQGDDRWTDGQIYNVENGKTYRSKLRLLSRDQLKLSGCVFIFCRSYLWNRAP